MNDFSQALNEWQTFYLLAGSAAATLIGLLFVAVSIHQDVFHRKDFAGIQSFAALTFNCFFYVLLIAMLFVVPRLSPLGLGIPLFILGALGLLNAVLQQGRARHIPNAPGSLRIAGRFNVPILGLGLLVLIAIGLSMGFSMSLYGLVVVVILFLASASQNAWGLLIQPEGGNQGKTPRPK